MNPQQENSAIHRRVLLKRLSHVTLGTITALVTATGGSYSKPTLKKMMGLSMAAAEAASNCDPCT